MPVREKNSSPSVSREGEGGAVNRTEGKAYFLSDLHLGAPYFPDSREAELRVVRFLDSIKGDATELYLLGDVLDYWYEYRYVVPRGFVRFFGKLAELSDSGVRILWIIGNHDIWIFDYIPNELGVEVADGIVEREILGRRFLLAHGDGIGPQKRSFALIRSFFRNRTCQRLFSAIHPRWTVPFAYAWSRHSRATGMPSDATDHPLLRNLVEYSERVLRSGRHIDYFIYGHLHILRDMPLEGDARLVVLGEWIRTFSYAVFDGATLKIERFDPSCRQSER
jgi:hypothetical protein BACCOPRO_01317